MSVYHPIQPDQTFDHAYDGGPHRRLVEDRLGPRGLQRVGIEQDLAGRGGGPAPYAAVGHLRVESLDARQSACEAGGGDVVADLPRFTSIQSVVQIGEIIPA